MVRKNEELLKLASYVHISTYRMQVLEVLSQKKVMIPTEIASASDILVNHISKILGELKRKGIIECINEEARKGRLYRVTELGYEVKNIIEENF